jgi:hypothetical protein
MQALTATLGAWLVAALGMGLLVCAQRLSQKHLGASLGMAARVTVEARP